ncbi:MAG TPA: UDP-3-O-(3-hydroxymyristoyl)glucosamine N-acyltransferase [Kiloniellaceae bacterium]|nr:UDP-3-O-(3-hydroxymyristoyl)glucosamine N-acyltransferase [Kiloniellaceae bacterium]
MADPRFFRRAGPISLQKIAEIAGGALHHAKNPELQIADVSPLDRAGPDDISFLDNKRYSDQYRRSAAGACIVEPTFAAQAPADMALIVTPTPYLAFARVAQAFYPEAAARPGCHASAVVDASARIGEGSEIGAHVVVGAGAEIGAGCRIEPGVVVGEGVHIGDGTHIGANASLSHCDVGACCAIHPGVRIGTRGFGFAMDPGGHVDVPQLGTVVIEDFVEIGANSTIDRGAGPDTVIGYGTKIDNLVQIGHNVRTGKGCVLVGQSGVAGSTVLEDFVVVAAQAGVAGHLTLGRGAQIAAASGVMRDVAPGEKVAGAPAMPVREFFRLVALWQRQLRKKDVKK